MKRIGEIPCFWRARAEAPQPAPIRVGKYFPDRQRIDPADIAALLNALEQMDDGWLLVLEEDDLPYSTLPKSILNQEMLLRDQPYSMMSRNLVTNAFEHCHGPALWPKAKLRQAIDRTGGVPRPEVVLPIANAQWHCNPDPVRAFECGFESAAADLETVSNDEDVAYLTLRVSLGRDVRNGAAYMLGSCYALLRDCNLDDALDREAKTLEAEDMVLVRLNDLTRKLRLEGRFDIHALAPKESRLVKSIAFSMPPRAIYTDMALFFEADGQDSASLAVRYREAASWLWGPVA